MRIIIIEDEQLMADELESLILEYNKENVIEAKLTTVGEAIDYLKENKMPELFFSDIQLPDGLSFEIFQEIKCTVPIVFCTAYDNYALDAFKANGIDYILKPFDNKSIVETLDKVFRIIGNSQDSIKDFSRILSEFNSNQQPGLKKNILIHKGEKIIPINTNEIALAHLDSGITYIYTYKNEKFAAEQSLDSLEKILGPEYYRINRQFLVERNAIDHVSKYFARKLLVITKLTVSEQIIVSKAKASNFLKWLQE